MAKKPILPTFGLAVDWETSGASWQSKLGMTHQGISLGLVVFKLEEFEPVDKLYVEIKFDETRYQWEDAAQEIHGLSREHLEANGVTQEEAAILVTEFIMKYFSLDRDIILLGHNIQFDVAYLRQLLEPFELMFGVHYRYIETSALSFVCFGNPRSNHLFEMTGLEERTNHCALDDALMALEATRRIRMLINSALYD